MDDPFCPRTVIFFHNFLPPCSLYSLSTCAAHARGKQPTSAASVSGHTRHTRHSDRDGERHKDDPSSASTPPKKNKHQPSNTEDKKSACKARLWSALCWSPCELLFQKNELLLTRLFLLVFFSLKPLDIEFMKRLHDKVNVIPLIAKADTLTPEECQLFKKQVLDSRVYISGIVFRGREDRYHFMKYGARDGSSARLKFDSSNGDFQEQRRCLEML